MEELPEAKTPGIDWFNEPISTHRWLKPKISTDSILHAIQHLGLLRMNVIRLSRVRQTKRRIYGFVCVSSKPLVIEDPKPFVFETDQRLFGPTQLTTEEADAALQKRIFLPQTIKNCQLTVNLLNFALLASTQFGERCGPHLEKYLPTIKDAVEKGTDLVASLVTVAFVHNLTAKRFPDTDLPAKHATFFAYYRNSGSGDDFDDRILHVDESGALLEFNLSDSGLSHFYVSMEAAGCDAIYAIVDDDSKALTEELAAVRQELIEEEALSVSGNLSENLTEGESSIATTRVNDSSIIDANVSNLSDLAEFTAIGENYIQAVDYDLVIEDDNGKIDTTANVSSLSTRSFKCERLHQRYIDLVKRVAAVKNEFKTLWFEGMEDYEVSFDQEYYTFAEAYHIVLSGDDKELHLQSMIIEEEVEQELQAEEQPSPSRSGDNNASRSSLAKNVNVHHPKTTTQSTSSSSVSVVTRKRKASDNAIGTVSKETRGAKKATPRRRESEK